MSQLIVANGAIIRVIEGSIVEHKTDFLVNSTELSLKLKCAGPLSRAILRAAGDGLQQECTAKYPRGFMEGEVAVTGAHNLPHKAVYHVYCPHFSDIALKADVIVYPNLSSPGEVCGELVEAAGEFLLDDCRRFFPNGLSPGEIAVTRGYNLPCSSVYHVCAVNWDGWTGNAIRLLKNTIEKCFARATDEGHTTIAFPVLGLSFPPDILAQTMATELQKLRSNKVTTLKTIYVVIHATDAENIKAFRKVSDKRLRVTGNTTSPSLRVPFTRTASELGDTWTPPNPRCRFTDTSPRYRSTSATSRAGDPWTYTPTRYRGTSAPPTARVPATRTATRSTETTAPTRARVPDTSSSPTVSSAGPEMRRRTARALARPESIIISKPAKAPKTWRRSPEDLKVFAVEKDTDEYNDIEHEFLASNPENCSAVIAIFRVQNKSLFSKYSMHRDEVENRSGLNCERYLWHGTSQEAIPKINNRGFNRSYCGKNATVYGEGVYFASKSSYSAQRTYSVPDEFGTRYMYCARVVTGQYAKGKEGIRVPPPLDNDPTVTYDTLVNDTGNPEIFVIFHDDQAYPEYLVHF